jgi:alkanesulfonate monooxygenase SsuD/methylene tetrahydromethanopterin reductase-like flavin-dependent oxidoreductase (luciferase family)
VFVKCRIDPDRRHARAWVAEILREPSVGAQLAPLGRDAELAALRELADPSEIPDDLVDQLTASGGAEQVAAALRAIAEAGADAVAVAPLGPDPGEQLRRLARCAEMGV